MKRITKRAAAFGATAATWISIAAVVHDQLGRATPWDQIVLHGLMALTIVHLATSSSDAAGDDTDDEPPGGMPPAGGTM